MSTDLDPTPGPEEEDPDPYRLARQALARAQDTARTRGFRTRVRRTTHAAHPNVVPGAGRDPVEVESSVDRLVAMMGWRKQLTVSSVLSRWSDIVGAEVASHCVPESFAEGELAIQADSTAWATQLRYLLPQIERRLAEEVGEGVVSKIHVRGPNSRRRPGRWRVPGPGPRDTWG